MRPAVGAPIEPAVGPSRYAEQPRQDQPHRPTRDADLPGFGPDATDPLIATFRDIAAIAIDPQAVRADSMRDDNLDAGLRVRLSGCPR